MDKNVLVYEGDKGVCLMVKCDGETVWQTQEQMCQLFGRERSVLTKHIRNVFWEGELSVESNVQNLHIAKSDKPVKFYNLDVVISVGYRVKSIAGTRFRQWATKVLRTILLEGVKRDYRLEALESRMVLNGMAFSELREVSNHAWTRWVKQIRGGVNYLVKRLSVPDTSRRKVGFGAKPSETSATPYDRAR